MKRLAGLLFAITWTLWGLYPVYGLPAQRDTLVDIYEAEKNILLRRISFEKARIENELGEKDNKVLSLTDSLVVEITKSQTTKEKRNQYLKRLQVFISFINRNCTDGTPEAERYASSLQYFPDIMEHDRKGDLLPFLQRDLLLSVRAVRLVPDEKTAEALLVTYMNEFPDDIFRYAEEFDDRRFALPLLEKALKLAPESARRYYAGRNAVRDLLMYSKDSAALKSFEMYVRYGSKSLACLLVNEVAKNKLSVEQADSIARNHETLFDVLCQLSLQQKAPINYSAKRFMEIYSSRWMRKVNHYALQPGYDFEEFLHFSHSEMFLLLALGHQEATPNTFHKMLDLLHAGLNGKYLTAEVPELAGWSNLRQLFSYCRENNLLHELLSLFPAAHGDYLTAMTRIPGTEELITLAPVRPQRIATVMDYPEKEIKAHLLKKESSITPVAAKRMSTFTPLNPAVITASMDKQEIIPLPPPEIIEPVKIVLDDKTRKVLAMKKNIFKTIQDIPSFINENYAEEVLLYAAQREPDELLKRVDSFKGKYFSKKIIERCAYYAPLSVRRYLYNPRHTVSVMMQTSSDPVVKEILALHEQIGYQSKPLLLLDELMAKEMTWSEAVNISRDPNKLFSAVVKIISKPNYVGKYSIDHEMRDFSLRFIRDINDKVAAGSSHAFHTVESFSSADLYFLMLYGRDEVFTSTFHGLFNRLMQKAPRAGGEALLHTVNRNRFRDFISLCSNFGRLDEFLTKFNPAARQKLLIAYCSNLEIQKDDLTSVVLVVEAISNMTDSSTLALLQSTIKKEFERVKASDDLIGISLYGVLSSMIAGNAQVEEGWYKKVSKQFRITPVSSLPSSALFDTADICVEQMYFYNDVDGRSSYQNFLNTYRTQANWAIEEKSTYVRVYSKRGLRVEIFANKPDFESEGLIAIANYMKAKYLQPVVVVHRGHSFHTETTLEKIPPSAKLIFVGSCGGFYKISIALENAPEAHIISTKQVGTMSVNDAMLFALNENIRNGNDIEWNEFWDKMKGKFVNDRYFSDYIPPNKNLESIFIRAYYKMLGV